MSDDKGDPLDRPWFGALFSALLLSLPLYHVAMDDSGDWPFSNYDMYSQVVGPGTYFAFHFIAVDVVDGKPVWWKPGFEYQARNVSRRLRRAAAMKPGPKQNEYLWETVEYVDHYLDVLEPDSDVDTLYIFQRTVEKDLTIHDEQRIAVPRSKFR